MVVANLHCIAHGMKEESPKSPDGLDKLLMLPGGSSKSGRAVCQFHIRHCADVDVDVATAGSKTVRMRRLGVRRREVCGVDRSRFRFPFSKR
jgi:hypothetical protein